MRLSQGFEKDGLAEALRGCDLVIIPAGVPRKPGMTRDDLFNVSQADVVACFYRPLAQPAARDAPICSASLPPSPGCLSLAGAWPPTLLPSSCADQR